MRLCKESATRGKYWNPKEETEKNVKSLKPSNNLCKSILGLNDYLTTALPNLHQMKIIKSHRNEDGRNHNLFKET